MSVTLIDVLFNCCQHVTKSDSAHEMICPNSKESTNTLKLIKQLQNHWKFDSFSNIEQHIKYLSNKSSLPMHI